MKSSGRHTVSQRFVKKGIILLEKKGPKWIDLYIPKLVKNVDVVKSISEMKNIHGQEKKLEKMWKKNCKVRGKYNLEVYITYSCQDSSMGS